MTASDRAMCTEETDRIAELEELVFGLVWKVNQRLHQIARDKREPDKVLLGIHSIRRELLDAKMALATDEEGCADA